MDTYPQPIMALIWNLAVFAFWVNLIASLRFLVGG